MAAKERDGKAASGIEKSKTDSFINCITDGEQSDLFITNGKCDDVKGGKWIVKQPYVQKTKAAGKKPC